MNVHRTGVVLSGVDGAHLGLGLAWWEAAVRGDGDALFAIRESVPAAEMLRSAVELILAQGQVIEQGPGDINLQRLTTFLTDKHRLLCRELAEQTTQDPDRTTFTLSQVTVAEAMQLVLTLGWVIQYTAGTSVHQQIEWYRAATVAMEAL